MRIFLAIILAFAVSSCQNSSSNTWYKPGSTRQDFNADMGQCNAQAFSLTGGNLMQIAIVQKSCMYGKGWEMH